MNKQIKKVENKLPNLSTLKETLESNAESVEKAKKWGIKLMDAKESYGMSRKLDEKMGKYLKRVKSTLKKINNARKPLTKDLDRIKKMFTSLENELRKGRGNIFDEVNESRKEWAKKKAEEKEKRDAKIAEKKNKKKERIVVEKQAKKEMQEVYLAYLSNKVEALNEILESATLANVDEVHNDIRDFSEVLYKRLFADYTYDNPVRFIDETEAEEIAEGLKSDLYSNYSDDFSEKISRLKKKLVRDVPSKRKELQRLKEAKADEKAKLKKAKEQREKREKEKREKEIGETRLQFQKEASTEADVKELETDFDAEVESEEIDAKVKHKITVKHPLGYIEIFKFWFNHEGKNYAIDKLDRTKLESARKWCQRHADKNDEFIDSDYLEYDKKYIR